MVKDLSALYKHNRIVGKANYVFTPEIAASLGSVYGSLFNQNESIVIGRDFHNDCRMLKRGCTSGLMSSGVNILNLSDTTFPLLQFTIRRFGASGGLYFSGGHLYSDEVGIRFVDAGGIELPPSEMQRIIHSFNVYPKEARRVDPSEIGQITDILQVNDIYIKSLQQFVSKKIIKGANLKVVIDCSYGPTGKITPLLVNDIGVEFIALNTHYRQKTGVPVPNINTIRDTAEIVKASNSHLGVCFDVDGSRILIVDENGLEVNFEDLLMLFIEYDERIKKSKTSKIITTAALSPVVKKFIEEKGYPIKQVENYPGEISRQIREERAIYGAADTLKFYFPQFAPISDGNFILLKILEIMAAENDLLSSLTRGFPKGIKVNKTISVTKQKIDRFHNKLRQNLEENNLAYRDIINELKVLDADTFTTVKLALNRDAVLLSAEGDDINRAKQMIEKLEVIINEI